MQILSKGNNRGSLLVENITELVLKIMLELARMLLIK